MQVRFLVIFFGVFVMLPISLYAAEGDYWQGMKERLSKIAPQKKVSATTAVGGVRGSKDQSADTLYWKDEAITAKVPDEEYAFFTVAFQLAVDGKKADATSSFQAFLKEYPQSSLKGEALAAINTLQQP